jgi:hypothetical protein
MKTFAELYCAQRGLSAASYTPTALRGCLRLPALILHGPICLVAPDFFAADAELVAHAGWLRQEADLALDLEEYRFHPCNQSRLRRALGLCISTARLRRLVASTLQPERRDSIEKNAPLTAVT